ncbi:MAG: hypothetical protein U0401_31560 [Anaerolineae bacterium]
MSDVHTLFLAQFLFLSNFHLLFESCFVKSPIIIQPNVTATFNTALKPIPTDGYRLPYPAGKSYCCNQGNNGRVSHYGSAYYAFDFGIPEGKDIVATRAGKVIAVEERFSTYPKTSGPSSHARHSGGVGAAAARVFG